MFNAIAGAEAFTDNAVHLDQSGANPGMYLSSVFSTVPSLAAKSDPRPPAPINARTTLLLGDWARPEAAENAAGAPAKIARLLTGFILS
jgi:hypothetical protein